VAPESYIGGPLAFVKTGDSISVDVERRTLTLAISADELERRRAAWTRPEPRYTRGYGHLYLQHIEQAPKGCDFDFLTTAFGAPGVEPEIH
jgi:dihydroxy-acid dehydratase